MNIKPIPLEFLPLCIIIDRTYIDKSYFQSDRTETLNAAVFNLRALAREIGWTVPGLSQKGAGYDPSSRHLLRCCAEPSFVSQTVLFSGDVWHAVLQFLSTRDVLSCAETSKSVGSAGCSDDLWRYLLVRDNPTEPKVAMIAEKYFGPKNCMELYRRRVHLQKLATEDRFTALDGFKVRFEFLCPFEFCDLDVIPGESADSFRKCEVCKSRVQNIDRSLPISAMRAACAVKPTPGFHRFFEGNGEITFFESRIEPEYNSDDDLDIFSFF